LTASPTIFSLSWERALKAAGLDHARIYDLRHSFASLLAHEVRAVTCI
jgi:integrase